MKMFWLSIVFCLVGMTVLVFSVIPEAPVSDVRTLGKEVNQLESMIEQSVSTQGFTSTAQCVDCAKLSERVKRLRQKVAVLEQRLVSEREQNRSCLSSLLGAGQSVGDHMLTIIGLVVTFLGMLPAWFALASGRASNT